MVVGNIKQGQPDLDHQVFPIIIISGGILRFVSFFGAGTDTRIIP